MPDVVKALSEVEVAGRPAPGCRVRYVPAEVAPPPALVHRVVAAVERRAGPWALQIADFLSLAPHAPIVVTVYGGRGVARTKGSEVVLPVNGGGPELLHGLAHELVHAVAGRSPHPVLNEGLAVHVDAQLRQAGPVWPFYHLGPHRWMEVFREEGWLVGVDDLMAAGAGRPVAEDRDSVRARAVHYLHAASLTGYLLERLPRDRFWAAFRSGELVAPAGEGSSLEHDWLAHVHAPLTEEERTRRDRSFGIEAHAGVTSDQWPRPPRPAERR